MKRYQAIAIMALAFLGCSYVGTSSAVVSTTVMVASEVRPVNVLESRIALAKANAQIVSFDCSTQAQWAMAMGEVGNATLKGFKTSCETGIEAAADRSISRQQFADTLDKVIKYSGASTTQEVDALISYATISMMSFEEFRSKIKAP